MARLAVTKGARVYEKVFCRFISVVTCIFVFCLEINTPLRVYARRLLSSRQAENPQSSQAHSEEPRLRDTVNFAAGKFAAACRLFPLKGKASKRLAFVYKVFVYQISVAFPCGYPNYREDHFGWWYQNGSGSYCSYRKSRKPARVVTN